MQHGVSVHSVTLGKHAHGGQGERVVASEQTSGTAPAAQYLSQPPLQRIVRALEIGRGDLDVETVSAAHRRDSNPGAPRLRRRRWPRTPSAY